MRAASHHLVAGGRLLAVEAGVGGDRLVDLLVEVADGSNPVALDVEPGGRPSASVAHAASQGEREQAG